MSTSAEILNNAIALSNKACHESTSAPDSSSYAEAAQRLSSAWQIIKETEIHEKYHREQQGFSLPGEDPINN